MQVPVPSQTCPLTAVPSHVVGPQLVPNAANAHWPSTPEQDAWSPHASAALMQRAPGFEPFLAAPHVPLARPDSLFTALHAWHLPLQLVLQQTPSAQIPFAHSVPEAQSSPGPFLGRQLPPPQ
jgi:hypothetical protein